MADWSNFGVSMAGQAAGMGMSLVGNTISGLINNAFYKRNLDLQVNAQKDLMDYQNAYNTPSAQMQRLQEAGLNPNLVYGSSAPAGVSGNATSPAGHAPEGAFNTQNVVAGMLQLKQMEGIDSQIELQAANAAKANAEAEYLKTQTARYNEVIDQNIAESKQRVNKLASDMNLNSSTIQLNSAKKALAEADEQYRRGQISLQRYEKQVLLAQANLFRSDAKLKEIQGSYFGQLAANADTENLIMRVQLRYDSILKSPFMTMKERDARIQQLKTQMAIDSAKQGFEGNAARRWTEYVFDRIEQGSNIFKNVGQGIGYLKM